MKVEAGSCISSLRLDMAAVFLVYIKGDVIGPTISASFCFTNTYTRRSFGRVSGGSTTLAYPTGPVHGFNNLVKVG